MISNRARTLAVLIALAAPTTAFSQGAITTANWKDHPRVVEIARLVLEIDSGVEAGAIAAKKTEQDYSEPYKDVLRQAFFDGNGVIRKFIRSAGSDDSAITYIHYYDSDGHIRFACFLGGAANGTRIQHRIYFDTEGNRIWEIQKLVEGPGYTFPSEWPVEDIVLDPAALSLQEW